MKPYLMAALILNSISLRAEEPVRAFMDDTQPGFLALTATDFAKVNSADDTWSWKDGVLQCTGQPVSVMRTVKEYKNFELIVEWSHQKPAGNSGVFLWATPSSIEKLTTAKPTAIHQNLNGYRKKNKLEIPAIQLEEVQAWLS